jgi:chemotaxis protein CheX
MTEQELKGFIGVITRYFEDISGESARFGVPCIKDSRTPVFDYTAVIGISGSRRGGIYFTAPRGLVEKFALCVLGGEPDIPLDEESLNDMAGEMTNTIAGNMRELFGSSFLISVPIVLKGKIEQIVLKLKPPVFIIPMEWRGESCHLGIGLE